MLISPGQKSARVCVLIAYALIPLFVFSESTFARNQAKPSCESQLSDRSIALREDASVAAVMPQENHWLPPQNVFSKSLPYMIPSAVLTLSASQFVKHLLIGKSGAAIFSEAFPMTLVADTTITLTSHFFATTRLEPINSWLQGKNANGEISVWRRSMTNAVLGTAAIAATWLAFGHTVTAAHVCGAAGLCLVTYPTLQVANKFFHEKLPLRKDRRVWQRIKEKFSRDAVKLENQLYREAEMFGLSEIDSGLRLLSALESKVTSYPWEEILGSSLLSMDPILQKHSAKILEEKRSFAKAESKASVAGSIALIKIRRRKILSRIVSLNKTSAHIWRSKLDLSRALGMSISPEFSRELHRILDERHGKFELRRFGASLGYLALAVGFFGGFPLESLNQWVHSSQ